MFQGFRRWLGLKILPKEDRRLHKNGPLVWHLLGRMNQNDVGKLASDIRFYEMFGCESDCLQEMRVIYSMLVERYPFVAEEDYNE